VASVVAYGEAQDELCGEARELGAHTENCVLSTARKVTQEVVQRVQHERLKLLDAALGKDVGDG
jgi:hypothetical protein